MVAPLVSLITKADPVPPLVKLKEVWVVKPLPKVKLRSLPSVVVMVLPVLYAACSPNGAELHLTTWFDPSKQIALPLTVCIPFKVKEELLRSIVIPLPIPGAKLILPDAVAPPFKLV